MVEREKQTFKCEVWGVSTKSELYLKLHVRKVREVEELKCDSCSYKAIDKNIFKCHVITKHHPLEAPHHCTIDECVFKCQSQEDLKLHIASSHDSYPCK